MLNEKQNDTLQQLIIAAGFIYYMAIGICFVINITIACYLVAALIPIAILIPIIASCTDHD